MSGVALVGQNLQLPDQGQVLKAVVLMQLIAVGPLHAHSRIP